MTTPRPAGTGSTWAIVLAGGEGTRLRPLVRRIHSDERPKQYAVLVGSRCLLRQTLDRVGLAVPARNTVVVTTGAHSRFFPAELGRAGGPEVLVQPRNLGTAAGILFPALWISWRDPRATVAIFPSDHFVADDAAFMRHVVGMFAAVERHPDRIVLLGATPDSPETGYGWIEPGMELEKGPSGDLRRVDRFREKPTAEAAEACLRSGGLWNTFVMAARVSAILEAGRAALPDLVERLSRIRPFAGTTSQGQAIERAYALAEPADFSRSVLAASADRLAVSRLPAMSWNDWGTPDRVIDSLQREGIRPDWLRELAPTAQAQPIPA